MSGEISLPEAQTRGNRQGKAAGLVGSIVSEVVKSTGTTIKEVVRQSVPAELKPLVPEMKEKQQGQLGIVERVIQAARPSRMEPPPGLPTRMDRLTTQPALNNIRSQLAREAQSAELP